MPAKVLTVAQQKGGAGKTTIAAHLAVAFAEAGRRVALLDIDPQASLATWYRVRAGAPHPAVRALALSEVAGWRAASEVARLKAHYELVIIDSPPHAETEAKVAVRAADLVLIPVQPSPMDVWAMAATLDLARAETVPILLVLNRVPPRGRVVTLMRETLAEQRLPVAGATVGNRVPFAHSMLSGRTVLEQDPKGSGAGEIRALAEEIGRHLALAA